MQWFQKRISVQMPFTVHLCHVTQAYLSELFLCTSDRLWNIIQLCGRHILSKTSKQSKVYKDDLLEDFLGLRNFYMQRLDFRLKRLNLSSLELRRLHCDLLWCYKIMFGHVDINYDDMFELRMSTNTRGRKYKLFKKHTTSSLRSSF